MTLNLFFSSNLIEHLINIKLLKINILMQQNTKIPTSDIHYSIGLVIICLLTLILLWLPDLLKGERN